MQTDRLMAEFEDGRTELLGPLLEAGLPANFQNPHGVSLMQTCAYYVRRRGVGRSLVDPCVQIVRTQGSAALCVIGNPHAYDFYSACGFDVIGTMETRFGSGLLMRKMV
ncbi:MAG: GNAT family N-acetyltransferase [Silvibacterium sp.]